MEVKYYKIIFKKQNKKFHFHTLIVWSLLALIINYPFYSLCTKIKSCIKSV